MTLIQKASQEVEAARQEGLAECRLGCLNNDSPAGCRFTAAYDHWIRLRAMAGDAYALSLGYARRAA